MIVPVVLSGLRDKDARSLPARDMPGIFIQVKNWQASELSEEEIDKIFSDMASAARILVPGAPCASILTSVNIEAINGKVRI